MKIRQHDQNSDKDTYFYSSVSDAVIKMVERYLWFDHMINLWFLLLLSMDLQVGIEIHSDNDLMSNLLSLWRKFIFESRWILVFPFFLSIYSLSSLVSIDPVSGTIVCVESDLTTQTLRYSCSLNSRSPLGFCITIGFFCNLMVVHQLLSMQLYSHIGIQLIRWITLLCS